MEKTHFNSFDILVVEDNPGDARLIMEIFNENKYFSSIFVVNDGVEAMDFLHAAGKYKNASRPDLIILDLNLPRKDGREVLTEIKADVSLKRIPVVIMTISRAEEDVLRCYNLHANCFITKPIDLNQFISVIKSIENFWFSVAVLPSKN